MYFIDPGPERISQALESWKWVGLDGMRPAGVTAFACVFFVAADDSVWFLDSIDGSFEKICIKSTDLGPLLEYREEQIELLMAAFVDHAEELGLSLGDGQCYDFKISPALGGPLTIHNVHVTDFVVALNIAGQIHEQVRHLPAGTKVSSVTMDQSPADKPWWKIWK